jgi:hypothetical protein
MLGIQKMTDWLAGELFSLAINRFFVLFQDALVSSAHGFM